MGLDVDTAATTGDCNPHQSQAGQQENNTGLVLHYDCTVQSLLQGMLHQTYELQLVVERSTDSNSNYGRLLKHLITIKTMWAITITEYRTTERISNASKTIRSCVSTSSRYRWQYRTSIHVRSNSARTLL